MICIAYFWCCYDLGSGALGGGLVIIVAGCLFTRVHAVVDMDRYRMVVVLGQDFTYHSSRCGRRQNSSGQCKISPIKIGSNASTQNELSFVCSSVATVSTKMKQESYFEYEIVLCLK